MNLKSIKHIVLTTLGTIFLVSCNKSDDIIGKEINTASANFKLTTDLSTSTDSPNFIATFGAKGLFFTAEYNEEVTSTIDLVGLESGAVKRIIVEKSDTLTETNSFWNGNHDGLYFFKTGEEVVYTLSFYGSDLIYTDTVTITQAYDFIKEDVTTTIPNGNFDLDPNFTNGEWFVGNNAVFWNQNSTTDILPVQGTGFIYAEGQRTPAGSYMDGASQGGRNGLFFDLPADPSRVWVNVYSYGFGPDNAHTNMYLVMLEADSVGLAVPNATNAAGVDDGMAWAIPSDHEGWALQSIKYSDIPFPTYCVPGVEGGGCGNKVREPNRIDLLALSFESDDFEKKSYSALDFIMFTVDEPLDPSKF